MGRSREPSTSPAAKVCAACGRAMEYRKRWARTWDQVKYCSDACRRRGVTGVDRSLEAAIVELLSQRSAGATICPSEAARVVASAESSAGKRSTGDGGEPWRELMEPARRAARRLMHRDEVLILQKGRPVDPSTARGPIRIGRGPRWGQVDPS